MAMLTGNNNFEGRKRELEEATWKDQTGTSGCQKVFGWNNK